MLNITDNIKALLTTAGTLSAYAWPGGYPLFYMDEQNNVLCAACANENDDFDSPITATDVNWESRLYCDHCSDPIEAAYDIAD